MEFIFFIFDLKSLGDTDCLISGGTKLHIFGRKRERVSIPLYIACTFHILKLAGFRRLGGVAFSAEMLLRIVRDIL